MQDFPIKVDISGGLAAKQDASGLVAGINLRAYEKGLRSVLGPSLLYQLNNVQWPFPQVFRLAGSLYVCTSDSILRVDGSYLTPLLTAIPNSNYPWSATEIGGHKIFTNNRVVVTGSQTLTINEEQKVPAGLGVCEVGSQLIIAAPWAYGQRNETSVMWGRVGALDCTIGGDNISALRYASCGEVLAVRSFRKKTLSGLHSGFVAFGREGITTYLTAPAPAVYSQLLAYPVGIISQLAVAGSIHELFFIDTNYNLCQITDGDVKVLGYQQHLKGILGEIVLSYDVLEKELWVSY